MAPELPPVATVTGTTTSPAGDELREVFSRSLTRTRGGGQLVVTLRGEPVVDLAGGPVLTSPPVTEDTPIQVYSVSKLVVAIAAAHAHESGLLDLDAPLAGYWPAFDRDATRTITARHVLSHSSGINAVARPLSAEDLLAGALAEEVERQDPFWEPGTRHGYHAFTFGALMAGVFANGVGTSVQDYAAEHVVAPAGGGFWFGVPEELAASLAPLTFDPPILTEGQAGAIVTGDAIPDGSMIPILTDSPGFFNDPRVQRAAWPAMSGVSSARSLSRIVNATLGYGVEAPLISSAALDEMISERTHGPDRTLSHVSRFGSGVELSHGFFPYLGGRSFGHQGAGGSVAAADPDLGLVVAYTSTHSSATVGGSDQAIVLLATAKHILEA